MKVLHYVSHFSLPSETFIYDLVCGLETHDDLENIVVCHYQELKDERPFDQVIAIGNRVTIFDKIKSKILRYYRIRYKRHIIDSINHHKPDVIHAHFGHNGAFLDDIIPKNIKAKTSLVITCHGTDINALPHQDARYKKQLSRLGKGWKAITIITPSEFLKEKVMVLTPTNISINVISNGIRDRFFRDDAIIKPSSSDKKAHILNIGRLIPVKGQTVIIDALALLQKRAFDFTMTIIGDGPLRESLNDQIKRNRLENCVRIIPSVCHDEIPDYLSNHTLYVQSSLRADDGSEDNMPLSLLEAAGSGLNLIGSDIGGIPEIINKVGGQIIPQNDPEKLAIAIEQTLEKEHDATAQIVRAKKYFSLSKTIKEVMNVYKNNLQKT